MTSYEHKGLAFNLLDTPRHQNFIEGTYRTLTAANGAVLGAATRSNPRINQFQPATGKIPDVPRCQSGAAGAGDRSNARVCL